MTLLLVLTSLLAADPLVVEPQMVHLRSGAEREWTYFAETAHGRHWEKKLGPVKRDQAYLLRLCQQDVKQAWGITLDGKPLGELTLDERDLRRELLLEPGKLREGSLLRIEPKGKHNLSDDIRIGRIELIESDSQGPSWYPVEVEVVDAASGRPLPCCITIVDRNGFLVPVGNKSEGELAVRTGTVYTASGKLKLLLPREELSLFATRGFEYSLAAAKVSPAEPRPVAPLRLALRREVPVPGHVACDTHIHTLTHSGHGDCTIAERMITLAGEGIELPIATDHNIHIDFEPHAAKAGVRQHFTPVMGNEFTTKLGHFNLFPVAPGARVADAKLGDWKAIFAEAYATPGVKVCILNHARDLHSGVRPFGPKLFNEAVAEQLEDWPMRFNAMEILNSGATQSDPLQLTRDWTTVLNRGYQVTPVGSSDSHDVTRFIVGQGRTYIRCPDHDPAKIDVPLAIDNFLAGRVLVSYGLLAELKVNGQFTAGDLATTLDATSQDPIEAEIAVSAPGWITATHVRLYANGRLVREADIPQSLKHEGGEQWRQTWKLPRSKHDLHLVAVATGPGIEAPYWATARPYQPTTPELKMNTLGVSGAVWIDGDGDGKRSSARDYAEQAWVRAEKQVSRLCEELSSYDSAIAAQAFHLYRASGGDLESAELKKLLEQASPAVRQGFRDYFAAWRESELARASK